MSSKHILHAIALTPYRDVRSESLLKFAHFLDGQDQPLEAKSAVDEATFRHYQLSPLKCLTMHHYALRVFECTVNTNLEQHQLALENAESILTELTYHTFIDSQTKVIDQIRELYLETALSATSVPPIIGHPEHQRISQFLQSYEMELKTHKPKNEPPSSRELKDLVIRAHNLFNDISAHPKLDDENHTHVWLNTIGAQCAAIIAQNVCEYAYLLCELKNNIAFNSVELGLDKKFDAVESAKYAVDVLTCLIGWEPLFIPWKLSERLGQYYDTQAWAIFRRATSFTTQADSQKSARNAQTKLKEAHDLLINRALSSDASSPVIYYHLCRVSVAQLELLWQKLSAKQREFADVDAETAHEISVYLRQALLSWRQAKRLAKNGSLTARLRFVRQRIADYTNQWTKLQIPKHSEKGDETKKTS